MDKKIVERLVDMGLIGFVGVDCDKFNTVDDLINSGLITATIDRAKLYEIIGEVKPVEVVVETPVVEPVTIVEDIVIEEIPETDVPADAEIVEEIVVDEVPVEEVVETPVVEETPVVTPKKKSNKKAE